MTNRPFLPGETFYSVLLEVEGQFKRIDYCAKAWSELEKPENMIGWWTSKISPVNENKIKLAPNDILMNLFDELLDQPDKAQMLYVLTLLLIRRKIFRYEREESAASPEILSVYAIRRETNYCVPVIEMNEEQIDEVQEYLASLLYSIG
ncbi:MAG: hypothetical protein PHQ75_05035 [Thermoguttaceae bacterium]|nr:hypothetical protein [Thermoguttaceae bacterium]